MNFELILRIICVVLSILIIIAIALQPSQQSGLIGDVSNVERFEKRGFRLFLHRFTIISIILLFTCALLYEWELVVHSNKKTT